MDFEHRFFDGRRSGTRWCRWPLLGGEKGGGGGSAGWIPRLRYLDRLHQMVALLELLQLFAGAGQLGQHSLRVAVVHLLVVRRPVSVTLLESVLVQFDFLL